MLNICDANRPLVLLSKIIIIVLHTLYSLCHFLKNTKNTKIYKNFYNVGSRSMMKIFIFIKIAKNSIKNREIYVFFETWVREISRNFSKSGSKITKIAKITIFHTKS